MNVGSLTSSSALLDQSSHECHSPMERRGKMLHIHFQHIGQQPSRRSKSSSKTKQFRQQHRKTYEVTPPSSDGKPNSVSPQYGLHISCPISITCSTARGQNNAMYLIMHAIGHSLGLGHSLRNGQLIGDDEDWGTPSNGTSQYDNKSIMTKETSPFHGQDSAPKTKRTLLIFPIPGFTAGSIRRDQNHQPDNRGFLHQFRQGRLRRYGNDNLCVGKEVGRQMDVHKRPDR